VSPGANESEGLLSPMSVGATVGPLDRISTSKKGAGRRPGTARRAARIRTVFADIEGTLTDRSGRHSSEALLHRLGDLEARGVLLVLCSGRSVRYQQELREKWGLDPEGPCVAENGCCIFWKGMEIITYDYPAFQRDVLISYLTERGAGKLGEFDPDKRHAITLYPPGFLEGMDYSPEDITRLYRFLLKHLKGSRYGVFYTSASVEVLPEGVDKGTGLDLLMGQARIAPSKALYIGDSQNDLPAAKRVLKGGGKVAAPANAVAAMKRLASFVSEKDDYRGAEDILDHFFPEKDNSRRAHRQMS